jgi:hypothetical protein
MGVFSAEQRERKRARGADGSDGDGGKHAGGIELGGERGSDEL